MREDEAWPTREQRHKDNLEGWKVFYDVFKHLTTLSTGSLVLLATLLDKVFKAPTWTALIALTFLGFTASLVSSLAGMWSIAHIIQSSGETADVTINYVGRISVWASQGGFLLGILSLIIFSLRNFY